MFPYNVAPPHPTPIYSLSLDSVSGQSQNQLLRDLYDLYSTTSCSASGYYIRQSMLDDIHSFRSLEDGWLGPGSQRIPVETAEKVKTVADLLGRVEGLPNPDLTPTQNGTISLEWASSRGEVYVEYGKTRISGFLRIEDSPTIYFKDVNSLQPSFYTEVRNMLYPSAQTHSITTIGMTIDGNTIT